jgi:hypothetical protein
MQFPAPRSVAAVGFSFLLALTTACGGSKHEAKAPLVEVAAGEGSGSPNPDPSPDSATTASKASTPTDPPPKPAVVSAENGSDIIPPFSSKKEPAKKSSPAKGQKKAGKPKKKG